MANLTSLIGPSLVNQGFFQFSRKSFTNMPLSFEPNLELPNLADFGKHIGPADFYRENRYQFSDTFSFVSRNHEVKVGFTFDHIRDDLLWSLTIPGLAIFTPESFFGLPPFGRTVPVFFAVGIVRGEPLPTRDPSRLFPNPTYEKNARTRYNHEIYEFFAQDQWRYRQLTLTYGVRYYLETVANFGLDTDRNNLQPRVGLAYGFANGKGVIRAGAGVFVGPHMWSRLVNQLTCVGGGADIIALFDVPRASFFSPASTPCVTVNVIPGPFTSGPAFQRFVRQNQFPTGQLAYNAFTNLVRDMVNPYAVQWSLQVQYELPGGLSTGIGYLGVRGLKVPSSGIQLNAQRVGMTPYGKALYQPKSPLVGIVHLSFPGVDSSYHGGFLTVTKRMSHNISFNLNYTFSKTLDYPTGYTFRDLFQDPQNARLDWGLSNQHVGQRFVMSVLGEGPRRWWWTRGFKLGVIATVQSPRYASVFTGFDANGDLEWGPDRVGAIGRNTYRGDRFAQVDVRVSRRVAVGERVVVEPLIEFFNLFNRVNVTEVNTVYGAAEFIGPVPRRFRDGVRGAVPSFGEPAVTGPARQVQVALRITF